MKTMKLWRKSRLSECHANSFANGRTGTIYVIAFMMLAAMLMTISLMQANLKESGEKPYEVALWMERR